MKVLASVVAVSPLGPLKATEAVRSGFATGEPSALVNEKRIRFSPTTSSVEIITG